jgi:signal transduction histidine kinase
VAHPQASDGADSRRLAEEQAALRRVATLVAQGAEPGRVLAVVAEQVAHVLRVPIVSILRFEADGTATERALHSEQERKRGERPPLGRRTTTDCTSALSRVRATGRPVRISDHSVLRGPIAERVRALGIRATVAIPISVAGALWGAMIVSATDAAALPDDTEARLTDFTELVATAIANSDARAELARLAEEQAALRRVATLVAQGVPSEELFDVVSQEVGTLLDADLAGIARFEADDTVTSFPAWGRKGRHPELAGRTAPWHASLPMVIRATGRSAREDAWEEVPGPFAEAVRDGLGVRSAVGSPVVVEGRVWGALFVAATQTARMPTETESRLENFTELVATAIANAEARAEAQRLAEEQAALRRVATLVARESPATEVLAAVAEEVSHLLGGHVTHVNRFEDDGTATTVAAWGDPRLLSAVGNRTNLADDSITARVFRTGRPARINDSSELDGPIGHYARERGVRSAAGVPILVDGRPWGAMIAAARPPEVLEPDTESRMAEFTALVATAISNIQARAEVAASRARVVAAADEERRRVARDLHDGAQQRLVHTVVTLKLALGELESGRPDGLALVREALEQAEQATEEVRELAHGILPSVLSHGGLRAAITGLVSRMPIPVEIAVAVHRLPPAIEATAYFVVAEALTNVAKHADASQAEVSIRIDRGMLRIEVVDDGLGGAQPDGSGLLGLGDRLAAVDGRLEVDSPARGGTCIAAAIPLT